MGYDGYGLRQRRASPRNGDAWKQIRGQQVNHRHFLRGEYSIQAFETEGTLSIEKVGDVRLPKIRRAGQGGAGQQPTLNSAKDFQSKVLMKRLELHVRTISRRYIRHIANI